MSFVLHACSLPPLAPAAAGHITSVEELSGYFSSVFGSEPHTVLLFLQAKVGLMLPVVTNEFILHLNGKYFEEDFAF